MKFGKQLQLGTYEPWKDYYIQYSKLKRIIKRRKFLADKNADSSIRSKPSMEPLASEKTATEMTPLTLQTNYDSVNDQTDVDLPPIHDLSKGAVDDGIEFFPVICAEMTKINNFFVGKMAECRLLIEEITRTRSNSYLAHHTSGDSNYLTKLRGIYITLSSLKSYCELSKTGFYKIIKKYDKTMNENTLDSWMRIVDRQPFTITSELSQLMEIVTNLVSRDKLIEWDRFASEEQHKSDDDIFPSVRPFSVLFSLLVFIFSLLFPILDANDPCANRCLSLLLFAVCMWVSEAIPYFATALLIPALVVFLRVLKDPKDPSKPMEVEMASQFVLNNIFNHTTMLLIGGYTISTAFSRCQIELRIASLLQSYFGNHPPFFVLAVMFLGLFLSMWISNHTAPILCATVILPIVRDLPTDSKFSKTLLLGLAYACNFGGMMTPISSLQNVLAVSYLEQNGVDVGFGRWICLSLPFCTICTLICWVLLYFLIKPDDVKTIPIIVYEPGKILGKRNVTVIALSLITIIFFAFFHWLKEYFGDIGIVAACFVGFMFGSGILSEVDFNSLSWHTLFLVGGGNVLGKAITSSGLLHHISAGITSALPLHHPWVALIIILTFSIVVATFVSHTVASLVLMPILSTIGVRLGIPEVVVIGSALAVSAAMALPFSSFPNVNSLLIVDDFQRQYLNVHDFLKTGLPMSLITVLLIATLGYVLILCIIVPKH